MNSPLLHIRDLTIRFQGNASPAVEGLSLTVSRGEVLAIVGESGSGKSITALSILRLLKSPPASYESGSILYSADGLTTIDLLQQPMGDLRAIRGGQIAMIFQEPMTSLNPVLTCGEQVAEAVIAHRHLSKKEAMAETNRLFQRVRLPDPDELFNKYPHQLSGGQKQRVMIAMAISCSPALLICDEPTTALDVTVQRDILLLLKELQRSENMGMIFISHDLGVVAAIADRIAVMRSGKLIELNDVHQLITNPVQPYTRALIACRPGAAEPGKRLPVVNDFLNPGVSDQASREGVESNPFMQPRNAFTRPLIRIEHLCMHYANRSRIAGQTEGSFKAVDDVSFEIMEQEILGLVGESGCGKSTLGKGILRLIEPVSGKIWFGDKDLLLLSNEEMRRQRSRMQIIFQDPFSALSPKMRIGHALDEVLKVHTNLSASQRKDQSIQLLEKVGLSSMHYPRYPHEFSGGQRQRIVIARALALKPALIICDESLSALDVSVQAQVLNLLSDLKKEFRFSALFISHDLSVVRYFCDRVMVMQAGRIVESGEADQVYRHPEHPYTQLLLTAAPTIS